MDVLTKSIYITPSDVLEYCFCPRFIYFMHCLCIPQHEEQRFKVLKGREVHEGVERVNKDYLRKRIGCVNRESSVELSSERYHLKGIVDEVLTLSDGTMAPLDYKYAEFKDRLYKTLRMQSVLYGLLIKDNYGKEVKRGYLVYVRSKRRLIEIDFSDGDFEKAKKAVEEILNIIQGGYFPSRAGSRLRCVDCCYKNICV